MNEQKALHEKCVNTVRFLAADAVEKAGSGHPGTPMGAAAMAYVLWDRFLKHNPRNPDCPDRDRFVLSPGHASMLLYAMLHLTGYALSLEDLKNFRQWASKTPGHPEYRETPGVEMTTGPLGQGFSHAVGMAVAERWLAEHYNRSGHEIINHFTYAIVSDGDMQEGVTSEAASLAGTLRLGKLICLYDANDIQIEGSTAIAFSENVARRFEAYGWQVLGPLDGQDVAAIDTAIRQAQEGRERPSLVICKTVIGYGSPEQATAKVHGEPLGKPTCKRPRRDSDGRRSPPSLCPVIRPADATETAEAWRAALLNTRGPTALILSRQNLPVLDRTRFATAEGVQRGAYVLWQSSERIPQAVLIATGSEVHIALEAGRQLASGNIIVRVVSMPSWEIFDRQPKEYREIVLPSNVKVRVAVEAGIKLGWEHYVGLEGAVVGLDGFGASAPAEVLYEKLGITAADVVSEVRKRLKKE